MTTPDEPPESLDTPEASDPGEPSGAEASAQPLAAAAEPARRAGPVQRSVRAVMGAVRRVPHPPWRSRRGLLLLFFLIAGFGSLVTLGGVLSVKYTETASFCGRCHTMGPELKAYQLSAHREVACAECHVEPGVGGFVKAKVNGTRQLIQVMAGTYPKPIPPPDHSALPSVSQTCLRCHSIDKITQNGGPIKLVLRPTYQTDEKNTRELVAVVLRPAGMGDSSGKTVGVHWHVQQKVTYTTDQPEGAQKIDLVEVTRPDGTKEQYVSAAKVAGSTDVSQDINQLKATQTTRTMDCLDCHNRAGHAVPSVSQALDQSMASGKIAVNLPYVKRESTTLLERDYASQKDADAAIAGLKATYRQRYPLVFKQNGPQIDQAVTEVQRIYRELASPDMKVQAETYPDNLGHQTSQGCFRCHDGRHVQVVNGKPTGKAIPSACSTCHTFPQVGNQVSGILLGGAPATHSDPLYVFNHKKLASSSDPTGTSCGQCHQRAYCQNCHNTGAVKVTHDQMLYNHAGAIRVSGGQACAYCHQTAYCSTCHGKKPVLDTSAEPADRVRIERVPTP
jgi:nitrate/TMAO reductase-like tetraheme cytochrome c subunit